MPSLEYMVWMARILMLAEKKQADIDSVDAPSQEQTAEEAFEILSKV